MTILHVVGKMKPEEAIPILQEMAHDEDARESGTEAKRYLGIAFQEKLGFAALVQLVLTS